MEVRFGDAAAHTAALQKIASATNPDSNIQVLNGGESSSVVRAGDLLYKSPHSGLDDGSSMVRFDAAVASALPETANLATGSLLAMPQLIATHPDKDPPYNTLHFVPGDILTLQSIGQFNEAAKTQLGRDLGSFVVWLAKVIPADTFKDIQAAAPRTPLTLIGLLRALRLPHIKTIRGRGYSNTADLVEELANTPPPPYQNSTSEPRVTGHGDLRAANLTFQGDRLQGIFDFGCLHRTDPAEQLRFTNFMGEATAEAAIQQFHKETQILIPRQRLLHYASAQAIFFASFCAIHEAKSGNFPPSYRQFLDRHYPDKDWSELDEFNNPSSPA